jgi:hypothetical protein
MNVIYLWNTRKIIGSTWTGTGIYTGKGPEVQSVESTPKEFMTALKGMRIGGRRLIILLTTVSDGQTNLPSKELDVVDLVSPPSPSTPTASTSPSSYPSTSASSYPSGFSAITGVDPNYAYKDGNSQQSCNVSQGGVCATIDIYSRTTCANTVITLAFKTAANGSTLDTQSGHFNSQANTVSRVQVTSLASKATNYEIKSIVCNPLPVASSTVTTSPTPVVSGGICYQQITGINDSGQMTSNQQPNCYPSTTQITVHTCMIDEPTGAVLNPRLLYSQAQGMMANGGIPQMLGEGESVSCSPTYMALQWRQSITVNLNQLQQPIIYALKENRADYYQNNIKYSHVIVYQFYRQN